MRSTTSVDMIMQEIEAVPYGDETWGAKLTVMKENLEHHIDKEENEVFKQARQVFDKDELAALSCGPVSDPPTLMATS